MSVNLAPIGWRVRSVLGGVPAAGQEFGDTVPDGVMWEILSIRARLTSAVAAANRSPQLQFRDSVNGNCYAGVPSNLNQAASLVFNYNWLPDCGTIVQSPDNSTIQLNLPAGLKLPTGHRIGSLTVNLQAADQWDQIVYLVRELQLRTGPRSPERFTKRGLAPMSADPIVRKPGSWR